MTLKPELVQKIRAFSDGADAETLRSVVDELLTANADPEAASNLEDAFYRDLDFGTGGLRGLMGVGTNRMNRMTVAKATQGLCNYIMQHVGNAGAGSVVIAHDSRLRSREFAEEAARVVAGNGLKAYLFKELRPTPELSFAVRHLRATAGVVVTASHNPKEYNGYKVSWDDGGQVLPPHDRGIIAEVRRISSGSQVKRAELDEAVRSGKIELIGEEIDAAYLDAIDAVRMRRDLTASRGKELQIVYTPLHGTGITLVPRALERWGFTQVTIVPEQETPDGNFPTTKSPNPEERAALKLSVELAKKVGAYIVLATDPDADRIGIAIKHEDDFQLVTGNQVGALLAFYIAETLKEQNNLSGTPVFVKTIVTTELIAEIARDYGIGLEDCLTGFKYIAERMRAYEDQGTDGKPAKRFLMGCEESYGYLVGTHARDKDSIVTACVIAEMALWAKTQGKTIIDILHQVYAKYGVHMEAQVSRTMAGKTGMEKIDQLMEKLRKSPPKKIAKIDVASVTDINADTVRDLPAGKESAGPGLPKSNVVMFKLTDGSTIVARPSGTEPKIKFYFMVVDKEAAGTTDMAVVEKRIAACRTKTEALIQDFSRLTDDSPS